MMLPHGSIVALVTPFETNGQVDKDTLKKLIHWHVEEKTRALVIAGTTGEAPTLTHDEQHDLLTYALEVARGRIPVIAGTGSNSTMEAIALTQAAQKAGADGALLVLPYYNRPCQEGLYQHFKAIHDASSLPLLLYDVPSRCGCRLELPTLQRLARLERIVGLKDATGDLAHGARVRGVVDPSFLLYSGDDATSFGYCAQGGNGLISVTANIVPSMMNALFQAMEKKQLEHANSLYQTLMPLHDVLFCAPSPAPTKYALSLMERCSQDVRLPLVTLSNKAKIRVQNALKDVGVL